MAEKLQIAFMHPDLGIGGAERLVVDCAVGLQKRGHTVTMYTSHHDPSHCFKETADGTLSVVVKGDSIPRHIGGFGHIFFATLRNFALAFHIAAVQPVTYDAIFVDQISTALPVLYGNDGRILFYGHFPDKLLAKRTGFWRKLYRIPFDLVEGITMPFADRFVVNSKFTAKTFKREFSGVQKLPEVVYPGLHLEEYDRKLDGTDPALDELRVEDGSAVKSLLSINRFERKKNLPLAIKAFALIHAKSEFSKVRLVMAGGYDHRLAENVDHHRELVTIAEQLGLTTYTVWPSSLTDAQKTVKNSAENASSADVLFRTYLMSTTEAILYTPSGEHFGIVPVEAMYNRVPVIAVNDGGPVESIVHGETGILSDPVPEAFAGHIASILSGEINRVDMGEAGRARVIELFSLDAFISNIEKHMLQMANGPPRSATFTAFLMVGGAILGVFISFFLSWMLGRSQPFWQMSLNDFTDFTGL
ncbi:UDP-Glycosyltransferase/glycogen phosphorylase [Ramicandelaber brevisporus]|nr:UDP-Glycosyltransferase/glycogen phosphorylase [Ramicandelaber brevisporus]